MSGPTPPPGRPERRSRLPGDGAPTVHLLVDDEGNRETIRGMLEGRFDVETGDRPDDADLFLIEDELLDAYQDELRAVLERQHPVFCPVVVIARPHNDVDPWITPLESDPDALLVDEFVEAPVDRGVLLRRLYSLLVRRQQSLELRETVADLSDRERQLRRFEQALRQTGNAIVITDTEGRIEVTNPAFERLTGYGESDARGRPLSVVEAEGADTFEVEGDDTFDPVFWRTLRDRRQWDGEVAIARSDDSRRITEATVTAIDETAEPDRDGSSDGSGDGSSDGSGDGPPQEDADRAVDGYVVVFNDVTDRIHREEELEQRERDLALLKEILTRYLRHNIRNDLNVIEGYAEMLAETLDGPDADRAATIVETARRLNETSRTARTYSDLIDREATEEWLDLSVELPAIVDAVADAYGDVTFDVEVPDACRILASEGLLTAIEELIENAAQHNTGRDQRVRVRVRSGEGIRVVVEDNGPGISRAEIETLERRTETPLLHSSGAGLWLSTWAIESLGGQLSFDVDDAGTRAVVELPRDQSGRTAEVGPSSLTAREQRFRTLIDRMTDAIVELSADWEISFVDRRAAEIFDVDADEVRGGEFWTVVPQASETELGAALRTAMAERSSQSLETYDPTTGEWLEVYVYPDFGGGLSLYVRDVTERREREIALRRRSQAMDAAPVGITLSDPNREDNPLIYVNEAFERITGYSAADAVGRNCRFLQGDETDEETVAELREGIDAREPVTVELRNYRADGTMFWNRVSIAPVFDADGELSNFVGFQQDVTDRKESELKLEERTRQLEGVLDNVDAPIWLRDPDGRFLLINQRYREYFDLPASLDVAGMELEEVLDAALAEQFLANDRQAWAAGETVEIEESFPTDEGEVTTVTRITPLYDADGEPYATCGIAADITERKRIERDLRERVRELDAFHHVADLFGFDDRPTPAILEELVTAVPDWFQHPRSAEAKLVYGDLEMTTDGYEHPDDRADEPGRDEESLAVETTTARGDDVRLTVVYTDRRSAADIGPFLAEERALLETILTFVREHLERRARVDELERLRTYFTEAEALGRLGVFELAPDGDLRVTDGVRSVLEADPNAVRTLEALLAFVDREHRSAVSSAIDRLRETGDVVSMELPVTTATGERRLVEFRARSVDDDAIVRGLVRDVTDRQAQEPE